MTLYQVLHEMQIVLALILGACPPLHPAINTRPPHRGPLQNLTKYY